MSKKQLVVAADVQAVARAGGKVIKLHDARAMVTAEARSLAQELGVVLQLEEVCNPPVCQIEPVNDLDTETVRRLVEAQIQAAGQGAAAGASSEAVMAEVLRRIAQEQVTTTPHTCPVPAASGTAASTPTTASATVVAAALVQKITSLCASPQTSASAVNLSQLDLTSLGLTTAAPCASGFIGWSKNQFAFSRTSDEINLVLEGELQFHIGGGVISAAPGDVLWVPKGTQGQIGTPSTVRYFYLSYPA